MEKENFLEIKNLTMFYRLGGKTVRAVDSVSFEIEKAGQAIAIVGESGCGKSSTGLALLRLLPKNVSEFSGQVLLEGQDILSLSETKFNQQIRWKKIAWVPQSTSDALNPIFKIGNQIEETLKVHGINNSRQNEVIRLLKLVGLSADKAGTIRDRLSGGEKQRVCIAIAIALRPSLIILDEPTSALDPSLRGQILSILDELKKNFSCSYIFITHDIIQASSLCEFFAVFYAGQVIEKGKREEVLKSPLHPYTRKLLECVLIFGAENGPKCIPGEPPDLRALSSGCRFLPRCDRAGPECKETVPKLSDRGEGHFVACHKVA